MRLGLYGPAASEGAPGELWSTFAARVGALLEPILLEPIAHAAGARGAKQAPPSRWDAVLVCGALDAARETTDGGRFDGAVHGAVDDGALPATVRALVAFARAGGPVLAVGAGFRSLCALGLLPGRVTSLADADARAGDLPPPALAHLRVEGRSTPFTSAIPAGRVISLAGPSASASAAPGLRYDVAEPAALEARGQVIFRYCDAAGGTHARVRSPIAGVCGEAGNVVGLLAGPAALEGDGSQLLGSLRMHLAGKR